jgi:hypothetical protein
MTLEELKKSIEWLIGSVRPEHYDVGTGHKRKCIRK